MDYAVLKAELTTDPAGIGYASMTDGEAAAALNAETRTALCSRNVNAKTVLHLLGSTAGAAFLDGLEAAAASNSAVKWVLSFLTADSGVDVADPETRAQLDALAAAGVLDPASVATIKAAAECQRSRAAELGLPPVREGDVNYARSI